MSKHTVGSLAQAPAHFQHGHQTGHGTCAAVHMELGSSLSTCGMANDGAGQLQACTGGVE